MKKVTLFRTVKQSVTFYEDDFNTIEEYNKFVDELINDGVFAIHTFHENMEDDENFQKVLDNAEESKNKIIEGVIKYMESNQKDVDDMDLVNRYAKTFSQKLLQLYISL